MTRNSHTHRPKSSMEGFAHIESYYQSGMRPSEYYKSQGIMEIHYSHGVKVVVPAGNTLDIETICSLIKLRV